MPLRRAALPAVLLGLAVLPVTAVDARVAPKKRCGHTHRAFTDGSPAVYVAQGTTSCATAKATMRRYWQSDSTGTKTKRITSRGTRWTCQRVTPTSVPGAWSCRSASGRSVITAAE